MGFGTYYKHAVVVFFLVLFYGTASETKDSFNTTKVREVKSINLHQNEIKIITLKEKTVVQYFYNITSQWTFVVLQTHSQYRNTSLSTRYNEERYTSSSAAIFKSISYNHLGNESESLSYILQPSQGSTFKSLIAAVTYTGKSPIPGGCCLTCSLEVDPNLVITSQRYYKSILTFSLANVYDYKTSLCSGKPGKRPEHYRLEYTVYQYFLDEGNLHDGELFDGLTKMLTPAAVKQHGIKVRVWHPEKDRPQLTFDTTRGQGIVFNILVHDPLTNTDAVYSPVVTYGCSFTAKVDGCDSLGSIVNIVLAVCGALLGLIVCFSAHRLYHLYIILCGATLFSFFGFILLTNETEWSHTVRMIGGLLIGIAGAGLIYLFWRITKYRYVVLYLCGLTFGFLLAAILFFTPFGNMKYWKNDVNYWTVLFGVSFTLPFLFLLCLKTFVILVGSVVGAYGFIIGIDTFIHSSLSYIVLDVMVRAVEDDFQKYDVPFQKKDYILSAVWLALSILGAVVQYRVSKGQVTLQPMPKKDKKNTRQANRRLRAPRTNERTNRNVQQPLLANDDEEHLPILVHSKQTRYGTNIVC